MRVGSAWEEITASGGIYLRNRGPSRVLYNTGTPADEGDGILLAIGDGASISGTSVWVRAELRESIVAYNAMPGVDKDMAVSTRELAIIDGRAFTAGGSNDSVASGTSYDFIMETGGGASAFEGIQVQAQTSSFSLELLRDPSHTGGSILQPTALNDAKGPDASDLVITLGATISDEGVSIFGPVSTYGADNGGNVGSYSFHKYDIGMILQSNTAYLLRLTNNSGDAGGMSIVLSWLSE